ncbi:MAG: hypothetical protein KDF60_17370 [Calditrichaeota bacterium]|nr:hypothetical protein [Calditrichota bacterium]
MKSIKLFFYLVIFTTIAYAQQIPDKEDQIAAAVQAAPEEFRSSATVLGYDKKGDLITLRKGTNAMICLADDPSKDGFSAAAYHKDLEPFMARGRELRAEGKSHGEIFEIREQEAKNGTLKMPERGATLHILFGNNAKYNRETKKVENAIYRYVVYIPWATTESTGLPTSPSMMGGPWIMDAGTHRAHIMINPPAQ